MTQRQLQRASVLNWITEQPGMTNRDIANRCGYLVTYVTERMKTLELHGFVRRVEEKGEVGRPFIRWYVREDHPPIKRQKRELPKASVPPTMKMLRMAAPQHGQVIVRGPAPDHDSSIVDQALQQQPDLQAAWQRIRGECA